jgi:hypothetical protein
MEQGERQITVDDLVALTAALGVNPSALLLPLISDWSEIEVTGFGRVLAALAWQWADGASPTPRPDRLSETEHYEFQLLARPEGRRFGPIVDPEAPGWSARDASPTERLAAQDLLFHRKLGQEEELAALNARRKSVEASDAPEPDKQAQLAAIDEQASKARALIKRFEELAHEITSGSPGSAGTGEG